MREPGLLPIFFGWAFFMAPVFTGRRIVRLILVAGIAATGSTAGFAAVLAAMAYDFFLQRRSGRNLVPRRLAGLVAVPYTIYLIITAPGYGYAAKAQSNVYSVSDRSEAAKLGLRSMADHPIFGAAGEGLNSAINLLGAAGQISLVGLTLAIIAYVLPVSGTPQHRRRFTAPAVLIAFLVSLTAQPLLDAPAVWMLCVAAAACTAGLPKPAEVEQPPERLPHGVYRRREAAWGRGSIPVSARSAG